MKNNKIQFLFIFFITLFTSSAFGIDYFWLTGVEFRQGALRGGVNVGSATKEKLKNYFNKTVFVVQKVGSGKRDKYKAKLLNVNLSNQIYAQDEVYNVDDENVGVQLTRSLIVNQEDEKKTYGVIAIPSKYKVDDVKLLNLVESETEVYLKAIKENTGGVLATKAVSSLLAGKKYFSIFKDPSQTRFAISGQVLFLDNKPVFYNYHGFGPIISDKDSISFLLKINGEMFFLARFPLSLQQNGWVKEMDWGYYLVSLEDGKAYLPMHLKEEK